MNCDDKVSLVKRDDDAHTNTPDLSRVSRLPSVISIDLHGMCNGPFRVGHLEAMLTGPALRMSRKAHAALPVTETLPPVKCD